MPNDSRRPPGPPGDDPGALVPLDPRRAVALSDDPPYYEADAPPSSSLDLMAQWRKVRKHAALIAFVVILGTSVASYFALRLRSQYEATAVVEISRDVNIAQTTDEVLAERETAGRPQPLGVDNYEVEMTSDPVLGELVLDLGLDANRRFTEAFRPNSTDEMLAVLTSEQPASPRRTVVPPPATLEKRPERAPLTPEETARLVPILDAVRSALEFSAIKETQSVEISFSHPDPEIATLVANGVAQRMVDRNFENKTAKYANVLNWLERTTRELKERAEQAEQQLAQYSRENEIYGDANLPGENLSRLTEKAQEAETNRMLKESLYNEVAAGRVEQLSESFVDQRLNELQKRLADLEVQAAQLGEKYGDEHPKVVDVQHQIRGVQGQIETARRLLEERLRAEYERAKRDEESLEAALERAKADAMRQNATSTTFNILKQEVATAGTLYRDFLQKTSQAKARLAEQHNNMRLVAPATVPEDPVGPKRGVIVVVALLFSLAAGVGLSLLIELVDTSVKTVEDVSRYAMLPTLGVIPVISGASRRTAASRLIAERSAPREGEGGDGAVVPVVPTLDTWSPTAEAYRTLRTSMLFSTWDVAPRTVLFTSGQPGEGKTTTVINTAVSFAQLGKSVLVIDADMRKPAEHKSHGTEGRDGLSTYLTGEAPLERAIRPTAVEHLWMMTAGPVPLHPAELVSSDRMQWLLREVSRRFDYVIIDSPPLMCATDPVILSTLVEGVILVIQSGKSSRQIVQHARRELAGVGAQLFGVVLNKVDLKREGYSDSLYMRYYADGYGSRGNQAEVR